MPWLPVAASLSQRLGRGVRRCRGALRPAAALVALGAAAAGAAGALALRIHILDAAHRDLEIKAGLAAEALALRLARRPDGAVAEGQWDALLPPVDIGPGGALALLGHDGEVLARVPSAAAAAERPGIPPGRPGGGVATVGPAGSARLVAWRVLPATGLVLVVSREEAVVLLPWRRGVTIAATAVLGMLGIAAALGGLAAAARARARA